jgi:hypothetical protein
MNNWVKWLAIALVAWFIYVHMVRKVPVKK